MKRDFTYIDDIVSCIRTLIDKNYKCEIFNLGNHRSEDLMYMIELIEINIGKKAIVDFQSVQPGDVPESFADIEKLHSILGYQPDTNLDLGIKIFMDWFQTYNNNEMQ